MPRTTLLRSTRLGVLVALGAGAAAIAAPAGASAGVVGWNAPFEPRTSTELSYLDLTDQSANDLKVTLDPGGSPGRHDDRVVFHDATDTVTVAHYSVQYSWSFTQCHEEDAHTAWCFGDTITSMKVWAGPGNDRIDNRTSLTTAVYGDAGDDRLLGGGGRDELDGGPGRDDLDGFVGTDQLLGGGEDDTLFGGAGTDTLQGGSGGDTLAGSTGADELHGGAGADTASYAERDQHVRADLDGEEDDDGQQGEGDTIHGDVENLTGGAGEDALYGDGRPNALRGGGGKDHIVGGAGGDFIEGGAGSDAAWGEDGDDTLSGGGDTDVLHGGRDDDIVDGGPWQDEIDGGEDRDWLYSRDGSKDLWVTCGLGAQDWILADPNDPVEDCETTTYAP